MRVVLEHRAPINLAVAGVIGTLGLHAWPFPAENVFLAVLAVRKPWLFDGLAYLYVTLWFSTPFIALLRGVPAAGQREYPACIGVYPKNPDPV